MNTFDKPAKEPIYMFIAFLKVLFVNTFCLKTLETTQIK